MPRRQFRSFPQRSKRGVNLHWSRISGQALAFTAGTAAVNLVASAHIRETCIRLRGSLAAFVDGLQTPGGMAQIGVGIAVVPEGTGTTVVMSPLADGDAPWMYYTSFVLAYEELVTDVIDIPGISSYREVIDNKAMRILRPDQELQMVFENITLNAALTANVRFDARALTQQS